MSVRIGSEQDRTVDGAIRRLAGEQNTLTPGAALGLLAETATQEEGTARAAVEVLARQVREGTDLQTRTGSAATLAAIGTPEAIAVLRDAVVTVDEPSLQVASAAALARVGDADDLDRLVGVAERARDSAWQEAAIGAVRLLGHRTGRTADLPQRDQPTTLPPPQRGRPIEVVEQGRDVDLARLGAVDRALVPSAFSVVATLVCGSVVHHVLVDRQRLERVATEPTIAAVILGSNETTGTLFVRWLVFTDPAGEGEVSIEVARPAGAPVLIGRGRVDGAVANGQIESVERPGASAVSVQITVSPDGLQLAGVSDRRVTVPRRVPTPDR